MGGVGHLIFILCNLLLAVRGESGCVVLSDGKKEMQDTCTGKFNVVLITIVVVIGAICNGAGAALVWCAQGAYLSECATDNT